MFCSISSLMLSCCFSSGLTFSFSCFSLVSWWSSVSFMLSGFCCWLSSGAAASGFSCSPWFILVSFVFRFSIVRLVRFGCKYWIARFSANDCAVVNPSIATQRGPVNTQLYSASFTPSRLEYCGGTKRCGMIYQIIFKKRSILLISNVFYTSDTDQILKAYRFLFAIPLLSPNMSCYYFTLFKIVSRVLI